MTTACRLAYPYPVLIPKRSWIQLGMLAVCRFPAHFLDRFLYSCFDGVL
jgi:hypothetical protein